MANALTGYNFAYLDEQTKRMIRRAILKAVAIPGYQVPFASREMPMPYGWGTGGVQVEERGFQCFKHRSPHIQETHAARPAQVLHRLLDRQQAAQQFMHGPSA